MNSAARSPSTTPGARHWPLLTLCAATGLMQLNVAAPQVALGEIGANLNAGFSTLQWVVGGYTLTFAAFLLAAGSLADHLGRRRVLLGGLALFNLATLLCAIAPGGELLVAGRFVQGAGAAVIFPSALAIVAAATSGEARRRAIAIWGAVIGITFTLGPLVGGLLVDATGWRSIFWGSLLLGAALQLAVPRVLVESRDPDPTPVLAEDFIVFGSGLGLLVTAVSLLGDRDSGATPAVVTGLASVLVLWSYLRRQGRRRRPLIDTQLVRERTFAAASLIVALVAGTTTGANAFLLLYLLQEQDLSALQAGLVLTPQAGMGFLVGLIAGRLGSRLPVRATLAAGSALTGLGFVLVAAGVATDGWTLLLVGLGFTGIGVGFANPLTTFVHLTVAPVARSGFASGFNNTARQLGMALSVAILGTLMQLVERALAGSGWSAGDAVAGGLVAVMAATIVANWVAAVIALAAVDDDAVQPPAVVVVPVTGPDPQAIQT